MAWKKLGGRQLGVEALRALDEVLVVETADRQDLTEPGAAPAALAQLPGEGIPAAKEEGGPALLDGLDRQPDAVRVGQDRLAELLAVEEVRGQLEELGVDVAEDEDVVFGQDALVIARAELVVEIPGRDGLDLVPARGFQRVLQPLAVVEDVQALGRVIEGRLGEDRSRQDRPIPDVVDLSHVRDLPAWEQDSREDPAEKAEKSGCPPRGTVGIFS
jgi:hypothetical protein